MYQLVGLGGVRRRMNRRDVEPDWMGLELMNEESFDRRDSLTIWLLVVNYSCMYRHDLLVSKSWRTYLYEQWQVEWKEISYFKIYDLLKIPRVYTRIQLSECNPGLDLTALTILRISPRYSIPSALACSQFHCTTNVPLPSSYLQRTRVYPTYFLTSLSQFRVTHFQRNQPEITVEPARRRRSTKIFPTCFSPLNEWKKAWMLLTRRGILFVKKKKKKFTRCTSPSPIILGARSSSIVNLLLEQA